MAGTYAYSPDIWPPLLAALFLTSLSLYGWRHRAVPGAVPLVVGSQFAVAWLLGIALEEAAVGPATKIAWFQFQAAVQFPALSATTCFVVEYAFPGRWLTRRNLALLALPSLLIPGVLLAGEPQLMWNRLQFEPDGSIVPHHATLGVFVVALGVGLVLANVAALVWLFVRSPHHRWPAALMLLGSVGGRSFYLSHLAALPSPVSFDTTVVAMFLTWGVYGIVLFGFRILDPLPVARAVAMEQMRDGMVVFDPRWCVAGLNAAAASVLGTSPVAARGKTLAQLLPGLPDVTERLAGTPAGSAEVSLAAGAGALVFVLDASVLKDSRGLIVGHLLLLHDVTEQRRAQARLLEEQWAVATLGERAQLAQELHDGLSQNLAFLNLQAQATELYLRADQRESAEASLTRLAEASREMQGDIRELIGNLLSVSLPSEGFGTTLRQIVAQYQERTGLVVLLDTGGSTDVLADPTLVPPTVGVQLIRIVQEALANVRKHAGDASQIAVQVRVEGGRMQLAIADDGAGFDPALPGIGGRHFGLLVMRQRAERVGGRLVVHSAPGEGTRIEVQVPLAGGTGGSAA